MLNLIGKPIQMLSQPVEHLPLCRVRCEVSDHRAFGGVYSQFFKAGLIVPSRQGLPSRTPITRMTIRAGAPTVLLKLAT